MTVRHRGPKRKLRTGYRASSLKRRSCFDYFVIVECRIARFLCAMRVFEVQEHHPHALDCLCAKFRFFLGLLCWASPWRKIAYSISQSLNHSHSLFDVPETEACASENSRFKEWPFRVNDETTVVTYEGTALGEGSWFGHLPEIRRRKHHLREDFPHIITIETHKRQGVFRNDLRTKRTFAYKLCLSFVFLLTT